MERYDKWNKIITKQFKSIKNLNETELFSLPPSLPLLLPFFSGEGTKGQKVNQVSQSVAKGRWYPKILILHILHIYLLILTFQSENLVEKFKKKRHGIFYFGYFQVQVM